MPRGLKLLIALAVVAGLLVAGDVVARKYAEREAAQRLRNSQQIDGEAQVHIHGFPFLTQALSRKLDEVEVTGADVGRGQLRLTQLHATLRGVRPRSDGSSATVESVDGTALVSYQDLNEAVGRSDVTVSDGGDGLVKVTGRIRVLGQTIQVSVRSRLSVAGGDRLQAEATDVQVPGVPGSALVTRLVRNRLDFVVPVQGMPQGLRLAGVRVGADGVVAVVQGRNVLFSNRTGV